MQFRDKDVEYIEKEFRDYIISSGDMLPADITKEQIKRLRRKGVELLRDTECAVKGFIKVRLPNGWRMIPGESHRHIDIVDGRYKVHAHMFCKKTPYDQNVQLYGL